MLNTKSFLSPNEHWQQHSNANEYFPSVQHVIAMAGSKHTLTHRTEKVVQPKLKPMMMMFLGCGFWCALLKTLYNGSSSTDAGYFMYAYTCTKSESNACTQLTVLT